MKKPIFKERYALAKVVSVKPWTDRKRFQVKFEIQNGNFALVPMTLEPEKLQFQNLMSLNPKSKQLKSIQEKLEATLGESFLIELGAGSQRHFINCKKVTAYVPSALVSTTQTQVNELNIAAKIKRKGSRDVRQTDSELP